MQLNEKVGIQCKIYEIVMDLKPFVIAIIII